MTKTMAWIEILWWLFTLVLIGAVCFPIYRKDIDFPYWIYLVISIILFVQFIRMLFLMRIHPIRPFQVLKVVLMLLCIPIVFLLYNQLLAFQSDFDDGLVNALVDKFSLVERNRLLNYIRHTVLFFGVGAVLMSVLLPFRLLLSVWHEHNKGRRL